MEIISETDCVRHKRCSNPITQARPFDDWLAGAHSGLNFNKINDRNCKFSKRSKRLGRDKVLMMMMMVLVLVRLARAYLAASNSFNRQARVLPVFCAREKV